MIEVSHLSKHYGAKRAVDDISFSIGSGEIIGFLGPNGAGKSTTMNMLTGCISATAGSIKIDGYDILDAPKEAKKRIGYLPELPPLYLDMTVDEYLTFVYTLKKATQPMKKHLDEIKALTNLTDVSSRLLRNLSKGYRQRAGLAQALVGDPPVLILDEPTIGLDPEQIIDFRNVITGLHKTTIFSTHILSEASAVCTRMFIISGGKLIAQGDKDTLVKQNANRFVLRLAAPKDTASSVLEKLENVESIVLQEADETGSQFLLQCAKDVRIPLFHALAKANIPILLLKNTAPTLEEIFLQAVSATHKEASNE